MQDSYLCRSETFPTMTKQQREAAAAAGESRPPLYNSEDYIAALKRFSRLTGLQMYLGSDGFGSDGFGNADGAGKAEEKGGGKGAKSAKNDISAASNTTAAAAGMVTRDMHRKLH